MTDLLKPTQGLEHCGLFPLVFVHVESSCLLCRGLQAWPANSNLALHTIDCEMPRTPLVSPRESLPEVQTMPPPARPVLERKTAPLDMYLDMWRSRLVVSQYTREDSNLQPPVPKTGALSN